MKSNQISVDEKIGDISLDVFQNENVNFSDAYTLFLKFYTYCVDNDLRYPVTYWNEGKTKIIYCKTTNETIAFITYSTEQKEKIVSIDLSYVKENYRSKGVFKLLLSHLGEMYKSQGFEYFTTEIPIKDNDSIKVYQHEGFQTIFNRLHKKVQ